ncbi:hypothetical protein [Pseudomonas sp. ACM7]|uniref:hypothetical protein n=1 Tax=Pseudomonas sp. ACM7 TaxID=2052956 RepID=UPI0010127256|nr:hypothetical protein [Pseudomonas sp. ACM7]QAY92926.1 hypothetical protein CUN63_24925 [Pseudomonas sp. ACM7]
MGDLVKFPGSAKSKAVQADPITPSALVRKMLVPGYASEELDTVAHIKGYLASRKIKFSSTSKFVSIEKSARKHTLIFVKQKIVVVLFSPKGKIELPPEWNKIVIKFDSDRQVIDYSSMIINAIEEQKNG